MHEAVSDCYYNLAILHKQLGKRQKALQYLRTTLEIRKELIGDTSLSVGLVYELLGKIHIENKDFKEALQKFQEAYVIRKAIFNNDSHPEIKRIALLLEELHKTIQEEMRENKNAKYKELLNVVDDQFSKMGMKKPDLGSIANKKFAGIGRNNMDFMTRIGNNFSPMLGKGRAQEKQEAAPGFRDSSPQVSQMEEEPSHHEVTTVKKAAKKPGET
jgi:tetratricopeptide (TPR) repeat protein